MATSTAVLVRYGEPDDIAERMAVAGFLAGYTGATRVSYTTDLRLFAEWCATNRVRLLDVKRAQVAPGRQTTRHRPPAGRPGWREPCVDSRLDGAIRVERTPRSL
jgi:hypothetical protein